MSLEAKTETLNNFSEESITAEAARKDPSHYEKMIFYLNSKIDEFEKNGCSKGILKECRKHLIEYETFTSNPYILEQEKSTKYGILGPNFEKVSLEKKLKIILAHNMRRRAFCYF